MLENSIKISTIMIAVGLSVAPVMGWPHTDVLATTGNTAHRHVVLQLGGYWGRAGRAQNIAIDDLVGNQYTVTQHSTSNGLVGLGYYMDGQDQEHVQLSYGVNGLYLAATPVGGSIALEHRFTNFDYSYSIQNVPVYLAAKAVVKNHNQNYHMTIDAGLGPNFMRTAHYKESPLSSNSLTQPNFSPRNNITLSAMAGVGLRVDHVFGRAPLECAYRFFYLGQGQLHTNNNLYQNTLNTGSTYANALLCSITI